MTSKFAEYFERTCEYHDDNYEPPTTGPDDLHIFIFVAWEVITIEGLLDAVCARIATKCRATSCVLAVPDAWREGQQDSLFYQGLERIAKALGQLATLKDLTLERWNRIRIGEFWCDNYFWLRNRSTEESMGKIDFRYEAIVLSHVCQIEKLTDDPDPYEPEVVLYHIHELANVLQNHPSLQSVTLNDYFNHNAIQRALLSLPTLTELMAIETLCLTAETIGEFVVKSSMRRLGICAIDSNEWSVLCSALGSKLAKLSFLEVMLSLDQSLTDEALPMLSEAISTNESLNGLSLQMWFHTVNPPLPSYGVAFARALANHPQLDELDFHARWDCLPEEFVHEVFCNGVAQMTRLRRLSLTRLPLAKAPIQCAMRQILPRLSYLQITSYNTKKDEWYMLVECMVNSRRLMTFDVKLVDGPASLTHPTFTIDKGKQLMEGIIRMNTAGRAYVMDGVGSKHELLTVLGSVRDNLDCLYIHLRESVFVNA